MNNNPIVSIIIPTYNRRLTLIEAVDSCLLQEGVTVEIIVVDDGSTDGTMEALQARDPRVRIFQQEHRGACAARNLGLSEARGRFIKFLDSDDRLAAGILATQINALKESGAHIIYGDFEICGNPKDPRIGGLPLRMTGSVEDPVNALLEGWWCANFSYLYRRESINDIRWSEELECLQDFDFSLKAAIKGNRFLYCSGVTGYYRMHEKQITSGSAYRYAVNRCRIMERALEYLRGTGSLTEERKYLIAHGYWTAARVFFRADYPRFVNAVARIKDLAPKFRPRFWAPWPVRALTRLVGIEKAERLLALRRTLLSSHESL